MRNRQVKAEAEANSSSSSITRLKCQRGGGGGKRDGPRVKAEADANKVAATPPNLGGCACFEGCTCVCRGGMKVVGWPKARCVVLYC